MPGEKPSHISAGAPVGDMPRGEMPVGEPTLMGPMAGARGEMPPGMMKSAEAGGSGEMPPMTSSMSTTAGAGEMPRGEMNGVQGTSNLLESSRVNGSSASTARLGEMPGGAMIGAATATGSIEIPGSWRLSLIPS